MIGCIGDREIALLAQTVGEEVVEHPAVLLAEHAVLRPADGDLGNVVGEQQLQQLQGLRTRCPDLPHVRDVEDPAALAHGHVLLADA